MPIYYIGGEPGAAAYRLAGAQVRTPQQGEELSVLQWARAEGGLVLLSAACAACIPPQLLQPLLAAPQPLLLVVPDLAAGALPGPGAKLRALLGLEP